MSYASTEKSEIHNLKSIGFAKTVTAGPLRIAINAQLHGDGRSGGIELAVRGLVSALGMARDDDIEYIIVTHPSAPRWIDGHLGPNQRVVVHSDPFARATRPLRALRRSLRPARATLGRVRRVARSAIGSVATERYEPTASDGFFESLGVDVVHFPYQGMVMTSLPSVYQPWDLQHLHYPEFFTLDTLGYRLATYPAYCHHAAAVVTASRFTRQDVIDRFRVAPDKVYTIPLAAATDVARPVSSSDAAAVRNRYRIPRTFAYYPAQTWEHKNHIRLLEALAVLRDRHGRVLPLVCTGALNDFWPVIERRRNELQLRDQVVFLGFVPAPDVRCLYRLASFVVIPSLFEGWGFPLIEAFHEGVAVASSSAAALRENAANAALLFDPMSIDSIANAIGRLAADASLRAALVQRGEKQAHEFSWERAARSYRALYRRLARRDVSAEDESLLASLA